MDVILTTMSYPPNIFITLNWFDNIIEHGNLTASDLSISDKQEIRIKAKN